MDEQQKLSTVIHHWIEHNESHMVEYGRWAQKAGELNFGAAKSEIEEAIGMLSQLNRHLEKALKTLGP